MQNDTSDITFNNTFSVGPPAQRFNGKPGETIEGSIKVNNYVTSKSDLKYTVSVLPYSINKETYRDDFVIRNEYNIATDWVTIDEPTGIISPNKSADVHFKITIPEDAPGGGQYFLISIGNSEPSNPDAKIKDSVEIASVIYLNVDGEIIREGSILENSVPLISFTTPVVTTASFENKGNTHLDAIINITATDIFTGIEVFPKEENEHRNTLVLPGAKKTIQEYVTELDSIGIYEISQTIIYNSETSTISRFSVVCPIWLATIIIVAILAIILMIVRRIISRRRKRGYLHI